MKKIFFYATILLAGITLAACGDEDEGIDPQKPSNENPDDNTGKTDGSIVTVSPMGDNYYSDGLIFYALTSTVNREVKVAGTNDHNLESVEIPEAVSINQERYEVTSVGAGAFQGFRYLKTVALPRTIKSIADAAFYDCYELKSITIPNYVTSIGKAAFKFSNVRNVTIPKSVKYIGVDAFSYLSNMTVKYTDPKEITFGGIYWGDYHNGAEEKAKATLHVPAGCAEAYKSCYPWNEFGTIIDDATTK